MAVGLSGSNGGITTKLEKFSFSYLKDQNYISNSIFPIEVSYFLNNTCNLNCKHCYVSYLNDRNSLSLERWKSLFNTLINSNALTFGNVGKEPLLSWEKTLKLLDYFSCKRSTIPRLRFGFVTNGMLLNENKIITLDNISPDYIDISLDGNQAVHDFIRGAGTYDTLMKNLKVLSKYRLKDKVFISFTLNKLNASSIKQVIDSIYTLGIKKLLISPYVTLNNDDMLYISDDEIIKLMSNLLKGSIIDFSDYKGLNIYVKNDFTTTRNLMEKMADRNIINKDELFIDDYGVIFKKYEFYDNIIYFNYMPFDNSFINAIRISHDGYVSNCLDMFYENYPDRAIGNVRDKSISEILARFHNELVVQ